ncbi:hypothetical protein TNCV_1776381 [Trichonephila clavipes]|nr:hypothetical protein TNCV_1776381 [Trichonephila clavipes]
MPRAHQAENNRRSLVGVGFFECVRCHGSGLSLLTNRGVQQQQQQVLQCVNDLLSEEFNAVDDDILCKAAVMADKNILEFVQNETEMSNAALVPTSSVIRNIMRSMRNYLDAHSNGEMNNKTNDI